MNNPGVLAAVAALAIIAPPRMTGARADEAVGPASASVRLLSGIAARYVYHFDRNALRDSRRLGDALIALTGSGNLIRFDLATRRPTRVRFEPSMIACLGRGEGDELLAGFEDGRVCRIDPASLNLTEVARLKGKPLWVGFSAVGDRPGRGVVAVTDRSKWVEGDGRRWREESSVVEDLGAGRTHEFRRRASAFLLDGKRRLWLGGDAGEWGGWCACVDLSTGKARQVAGIKQRVGDAEGSWDGVYGFVELRDGQVWAHGGTSHMGSNQAFIRRVDRGDSKELFRSDNSAAIKARMAGQDPPESDQPQMPITQIVEQRDGGLAVFAYSDIYRTDAKFERWTRLHKLRIRYRWGRPDAVGAYPSVRAVHPLAGKDSGLLCATVLDGYVLVAGDKEMSYALPGQPGADEISRIETTEEGTIFLEGNAQAPPWRLRGGVWEPAPLPPPVELLPEEAENLDAGDRPSWYETRVMVGRAGSIFTVSSSAFDPGTRTTARRVHGKAEVLGRESSSLNPSACFVTPDGTLWNTGDDVLRRFLDGKWEAVAGLPAANPEVPADDGLRLPGRGLEIGYGLRAVGEDSPPWVLRDREEDHLLSLAPGEDGADPQLDLIRISEGDRALRVHDAIPWTKGVLLLATDKGLRTFERCTGKLGPSPLPEPDGAVRFLCRDGLGRLWSAGDGLWMTEPGAKESQSLAALPMLGRTAVTAIAADADHPDGAIASLGGRGVVFVRIERSR